MGFLVVFGFFFCSRQDSPTKVDLGESPLDHWRGGGTKGIGKGTHFDQKKGKGHISPIFTHLQVSRPIFI